MKIALTITFTNGEKRDADAKFPDFVAFERTWNRSVTKFEEELRLTDLAWLAWHSEKRCMRTQDAFDPIWINTVEMVEVKDESESGETPLEKAPSTGQSFS